MRVCSLLLLPGLLLFSPVAGSAQVNDLVDGYMSGRQAGTRPRVTMPWGVSAGTITLLTALDHGPVTNNRVVRAAVVNAAIGAGVSWTVNKLIRPEPSAERNPELLQASLAYRQGFSRGFHESLGGRQMISNLLGVITGSLISGTIYMVRK
jgi:hypothetical protein